jgi:hypothetical protein
MPGFVEVGPEIWQPANYVPSPYELSSPAIRNDHEAKLEISRCARSLKHFVFHHVWSLHNDDPSGRPQYRKFPHYAYLEHFFDNVQRPCNVHVEKSRQMTMSIAWCAVFLWDILFHDNWAGLFVSRRDWLVDDGGIAATTNSLFGKTLHMWQSLPRYLRYPLRVRKGLIQCDTTHSHIEGHTGSPSTGRGSTYNRALMDECAHLEYGNTLHASLSQACKTGLAMSDVPFGTDNVFYRVRHNPLSGFKYLNYHWSVHPDKSKYLYCQCGWKADPESEVPLREQYDIHERIAKSVETIEDRIVHQMRSPWYDRATAAMTPEIVAAEFDINYSMSRRGRVFETFDSSRQCYESVKATGAKRETETPEEYRERYLRTVIMPGVPCVVGWDFGVDDPTSLVLGQILDEELMYIRWLDDFEDRNKSWDYYASFVNGLWAPIVREVTGFDLMHYGDPAGKQRASDLMSWITNLRSAKPSIVVVHHPKRGSLLEWIDFTHNRIRKGNFEVSRYATKLIDHLEQYHYPTDDEGNLIPGRQEPVHDEHSHACSALRYVYQFRWSHRLIGDGIIVQPSQILAVDAVDVRRSDPDPREVMQTPKRLNYF